MDRRLLLLPLVLLLAFFGWRHFNPPRGEREVIAAQVESLRLAAQKQDVNGILSRLDKDFKIQGVGKSELRGQLVALFFTRGDIKLGISGLDIQVSGDQATSSGRYTLSSRSAPGAPEESTAGDFRAKWKKSGGQWKITGVEGVDSLAAP